MIIHTNHNPLGFMQKKGKLHNDHCWVQVYSKERPIFGKEDLILDHTQQVARKYHT
jgi:hypothetical protein